MKFRINIGGEDNIQVIEGNCPTCDKGPYTIIMLSEKLLRNTVAKKYFVCLCCNEEFSATVSTIDKKSVEK